MVEPSSAWEFGERDVVPKWSWLPRSVGDLAQVETRWPAALAYPCIRDGKLSHSHMAAVLPEFRDLGIGRLLLLAQRGHARAFP